MPALDVSGMPLPAFTIMILNTSVPSATFWLAVSAPCAFINLVGMWVAVAMLLQPQALAQPRHVIVRPYPGGNEPARVHQGFAGELVMLRVMVPALPQALLAVAADRVDAVLREGEFLIWSRVDDDALGLDGLPGRLWRLGGSLAPAVEESHGSEYVVSGTHGAAAQRDGCHRPIEFEYAGGEGRRDGRSVSERE